MTISFLSTTILIFTSLCGDCCTSIIPIFCFACFLAEQKAHPVSQSYAVGFVRPFRALSYTAIPQVFRG